MQYSILIYGSEAVTGALSEEEHASMLEKHRALQAHYRERGKLGPVARLMPTTAATTVRAESAGDLVIDGPFAETKEQLLGFYVLECDTLEEAIDAAKMLPRAHTSIEVRPIAWFDGGA